MMLPPKIAFKPAVLGEAAQHLEDFALANIDVKLTLLTSGDGFEIAAHPATGATTARIAAMSSSMQALSQALTREAGLTKNRSLIIETDTGTVVVLDLDESLPKMSLAIVASSSELLGKLLWASRNLCRTLEKTLSQ